MRLRFVLLFFSFYFFNSHPQIIFNMDGGYIGDHLTSLYNAFVYAKKYNLELRLGFFGACEKFECFNLLQMAPSVPSGKLILIKNEHDVINNLHRPDVCFYTNVLSARPTPDPVTALEARQLLMPNKNLDLDHLKRHETETTIAVHIRKGNGGAHYDGQLSSQQIFDFNRKSVHYTHDQSNNPFTYFRKFDPLVKTPLDRINGWLMKFPPEQYYIDQINKIITAKGPNISIVIKIITDDIDPQSLVNRIKGQIQDNNVKVEYYDNRNKDLNTRIIEDLYILSQCDYLIRSKSGFGLVAEIMGNYKSVFFPISSRWEGNKLIMTNIVIRGEYI